MPHQRPDRNAALKQQVQDISAQQARSTQQQHRWGCGLLYNVSIVRFLFHKAKIRKKSIHLYL